MRIGPTQRLGPDLVTEWGTYPSPYFTSPEENTRVVQYLPPTIQGRHQFRTQPRSLSPLPADPAAFRYVPSDMLDRARSTLVVDSDTVDAHGVGADGSESKLSLYIFLGLIGLAAVALGRGK